ncbi:glycosyl hydrolase family 28-related protein [Herpetosiphon gulosus]|uniref:Rhamnogalacturonase A/B/Epimerase-like pectate lyase domain-containing protein n=1 Tax=Herpetosiphon gulosus TaxID=1973496 RepID=A0ABP9X6R6_9CHLR
MSRLPSVDGDEDAWGDILNEYLLVGHHPDGTHKTAVFGIFNVHAFGAIGDGVTDDTSAIQAALNAAAPVGGVVWLTPTAHAYRCHGGLTIPPHVTLKGGYSGMRRGLQLWGEAARGSTLHVYTTDVFLTMSHNTILDGVEIFYPEQVTQGTPTPYGWTILVPSNQHGVTIRNITCPNPYQLLSVNADGILIDSIQGYPLMVGIKLGRVADVARITNIQFNPNVWAAAGASLRTWVQTTGFCLDIEQAEEFMVQNFFGYGYLRGIWFRENLSSTGFPGSYGSINNFGFDSVQEGIIVETRGVSNRQGVSLSNGRIIPFAGTVGARTGIKLSDTGTPQGPALSMSNVSFFGAHERSIWIQANSGVRMTILGGQSTEYTNEMVLCESATGVVRLVGVRSFNGIGPRINNLGGGNVSDTAPMAL